MAEEVAAMEEEAVDTETKETSLAQELGEFLYSLLLPQATVCFHSMPTGLSPKLFGEWPLATRVLQRYPHQ